MKSLLAALGAVLLLAAAPASHSAASPGPSEIVSAGPKSDWKTIAPQDLLVMDLVPKADGTPRRVVIQMMPAPFAQGWIENIRRLASARWWDGTAIVRVQDNYVAQWGDPDAETPGKARPLPDSLTVMRESDYESSAQISRAPGVEQVFFPRNTKHRWSSFYDGWPVAGGQTDLGPRSWPVHCYGMVGAGRGVSPDTGSGAELYAVIGHAPRHLDRNIALVGRVIAGIEHLSSLSRGAGPLGFYLTPVERTGILSIRLGSDVPKEDRPAFEYLSTDSATFRAYAAARANRRDAFFNIPSNGTDVCNIPVPVRSAN